MEREYTTYVRISPFQLGLAFVVVFVMGFLLGNQITVIQAQSPAPASASASVSPNTVELFSPLYQAYNLIQNEYVTEIEDEALIDGAIAGMIDALDDPYSDYLSAEAFDRFDVSLSGNMEGIGATIRTNPDTDRIEVVNTLPNTPARAAGVQPGDVFYEVDGVDVSDLNQLELLPLVRGPAGSTVNIVFERGDDLVEVAIVRERFEVPSVDYEVLENDIGYVQLIDFSALSRRQLDNAFNEMDVNTLNGLVLDLRGNPGGLLTSAVEVTSAFLEDGVVLYERFGDGREVTFEVDGTYYGLEVPLVLLVDGASASAAELLAGALQDAGVAVIVGDVTFGKGTVQVLHRLMNGGGMRLTIAEWLTPNRNPVSEVGIFPDVLVELPEDFDYLLDDDIQLLTAVNYLLELAGMEPVEEVSR